MSGLCDWFNPTLEFDQLTVKYREAYLTVCYTLELVLRSLSLPIIIFKIYSISFIRDKPLHTHTHIYFIYIYIYIYLHKIWSKVKLFLKKN